MDVPITMHATGTFEVKLLPSESDDASEASAIKRFLIDKQFQGDLEGISTGQLLGLQTKDENSGGYVAVEEVTGSLNGRNGSFVLQHSGAMMRGALELIVTVVPDSGTDELAGLIGRMEIMIEEGLHSYDFKYRLSP